MNRGPVIVVGDVKPDVTIHLSKPINDAAPHASKPSVSGGGTGANVAAALARLGVEVSFQGAVGNDRGGRTVIRELQETGVDTSPTVVLNNVETPIVIALLRPDGERILYRWPPDEGADWALRPEHLDHAKIKGAAWLHTTGICLRRSPSREAVLTAIEVARDAGVKVSFDMNFRPEQKSDDAELIEAFDQAIAGAQVLFGDGEEEFIPFTGKAKVEEAARELGTGNRIIVARMGASAALVFSPEGELTVPSFQTKVVNTVGAGDAFDGGFIAAQLDGLDLRDCVRWGHAVAALKISKGGARALPTRNEVREFLEEPNRAARPS